MGDVLAGVTSLPVLDGTVNCPDGVVVLSQTCDVVRTESPHVTLARIVRLDADAARDARAGKRPSERVFMGAHFKIAQSARVSPRVHYLDATATTGCIYVGYIGPHLPTATS